MDSMEYFLDRIMQRRYFLRIVKGQEWVFTLSDDGNSILIKNRPLFSEDYTIDEIPPESFLQRVAENHIYQDHIQRLIRTDIR